MSEDNIFIHADRSLMAIYNDVSREFQTLSTQLGFDELNVMGVRRSVFEMYKRMDANIRRQYMIIARKAYRDALLSAMLVAPTPVPAEDDFDYHNFVVSMLRAYDPLSDFVYTHEWLRKRDRLFESIVATQRGNQEMRKNLKRGMDVLANQIRQYADNITVGARLKAFKDAGVKYVRWVAEMDDRTCKTCWDNDGKVYRLDEAINLIPKHWRCRCIWMPSTKEEYLAQQAA